MPPDGYGFPSDRSDRYVILLPSDGSMPSDGSVFPADRSDRFVILLPSDGYGFPADRQTVVSIYYLLTAQCRLEDPVSRQTV